MSLSNMLFRLNSLGCYLLLLIIVIDPANKIFGLKQPVFFACIILSLLYGVINRKRFYLNKTMLLIFFALMIISLYGYVRGLLFQGGYDQAFGVYYLGVFVPLFLLFSFPLVNFDFEIAFIRVLIIFSICLFFLSLVLILYIDEVQSIVNLLNYQYESSMIGFRDYGGFNFPMIYYKTSILLVFLSGYLLQKKGFYNFLLFMVVVYLLFISGTRANMLVSLLFLIVYAFIRVRSYLTLPHFLSLVLGGATFLLILMIGFSEIISSTFLSSSETSNAIKLGHFHSYIEFFDDNLSYLLFGAGYGSGMYTSSVGQVLFSLELTYLELIRFLGLFGTLFFIFILVYPLVSLFYNRSSYFYSWFYYLLIAGSNPLVLSSTGAFALLFIYYVTFSKQIHRKISS